ncbi:hypothetical protein T484DRAFT_1866935 [Baffinella frigidus]|nr:hypothetical protein T484DRAFT_1866935 [Cryptophyta sp. CCMP2293]
MPEVLVHVPHASNMEGIARFYAKLVGASVSLEDGTVRVRCGLYQTLVFAEQPSGVQVEHSDYHVSMYVEDFPGIFQRVFQG